MLKSSRDHKLKNLLSYYLATHKSQPSITAFKYSTSTADDSGSASAENARPPPATKVVICGGGLYGTSVAYHLAELGYKDVVLLTRDKIGSGTTFYSTGVISTTRTSKCETLLTKYSINLYQALQKNGHQIEFNNCGSVGLSTNRNRWHTIKRQVAETKNLGIDRQLLSADECLERFPFMRADDVDVRPCLYLG